MYTVTILDNKAEPVTTVSFETMELATDFIGQLRHGGRINYTN